MSQEEEKEENLSTIEVEKTVFQTDTVAPEFYGDEQFTDGCFRYESDSPILKLLLTFSFFVSFLSTHIKTGF